MASDAPRRWTGRLRRLITTVPFLVTVAVLVVLVIAYTLAGFFLCRGGCRKGQKGGGGLPRTAVLSTRPFVSPMLYARHGVVRETPADI
jgi:hypothetical protein